MFGISVIFKGVVFAGMKSNILDVTRHYAGVVQGIENGLGGIVGVILPSIVYYIAPDVGFVMHPPQNEYCNTYLNLEHVR